MWIAVRLAHFSTWTDNSALRPVLLSDRMPAFVWANPGVIENSRSSATLPLAAKRREIEHIYRKCFTSTFELRPLVSYRARRAADKSSGEPSTKPPFDMK